MAARVRVLLVEDDPTLQRFVAMALEDDEVRLQACISVDEALLALATQSFDLVISDLMLPGRHGLDLLQTLKQRPQLRGHARLAVFSAGLNPAVREQLEALGVTRFLSKPCSLADLQSCLDGLSGASAASAMPSIHQAAIEQYFGGNAALYQAFLARCRVQFPLDIAAGRVACEQGEHVKLRHLAHSLKSVLLTLGHAEAAGVARQLEQDAQLAAAGSEDALAAVRAAWPVLEDALAQLL
ncbi:response regulator [Mitsuaria sp. GD03876]|uniref:response regulator n=1 Tax=Mitsuaria sp. GD03876 TaxID=2975399 RepID=UPI0024474DBD|nr:response regulator [Mitsuaria sp. GD03876]MDH0865701.1 response regulator [Mitsuaria sp. GD03876]